jgi:hypothetical protein
MSDHLEQLVESLLYEGYALYPYTPGATKNATPTPFGIVYPPGYAEGNQHAFDRLRMECLVDAKPGAIVRADVRFLEASGERHQAAERRVELPPVVLEDLAREPVTQTFVFEGVQGRVRMAATLGDAPRVVMCVHNTTDVPGGLDRAAALRHSLLSTHPLLRVDGGRFLSPLEPAAGECRAVNTFPVLVTPEDDAVLGAAIMLPDHPQIAPESRGNLFDNTEIEEALLLHVQVLSDAEREEVAGQDPVIREMLARAQAATPEDIVRLHGRVTVSDPAPDDRQGEPEAVVGGVTYHRGDRVVLRPGTGGDPYDGMLDGRQATIHRIFVDYDDRVHLGVTVDGDPVQDLFRDTGRYLFFKPTEVELT